MDVNEVAIMQKRIEQNLKKKANFFIPKIPLFSTDYINLI